MQAYCTYGRNVSDISYFIVKEQHILVTHTRTFSDAVEHNYMYLLLLLFLFILHILCIVNSQNFKKGLLLKVGKLFTGKNFHLLETLVYSQHLQQLPGGRRVLSPAHMQIIKHSKYHNYYKITCCPTLQPYPTMQYICMKYTCITYLASGPSPFIHAL